MNIATLRRAWSIAGLLALLMLLTRTGHFGDAVHLPDASMAIFFLGGLYVRRHLAFLALFVLSVAIDWVAIKYAGVSNYCVTAAYAFMPVAYGVLWYGARAYARRHVSRFGAFALAAACTALSFLVSNGSFYWLGGRVATTSVSGWLANAWQWGPHFMQTTLIYVGCVLLAVAVGAHVRAMLPVRSAA